MNKRWPLVAQFWLFLGLVGLLPVSQAQGQTPTGSAMVPADKSQLRDITGIEETGPEPSWPIGATILGMGCLAVLILFLVGWRWGWFRRRSLPPLPPALWAARALDRLEADAPQTTAETEHFHTLLCDVLRTYLEMRFRLPASRQTTPEFLASAQASAALTVEQQALLRGFLDRCDLAKFARASYSRQECLAAVRMGREFVERTDPVHANSHVGEIPPL